MDTRYTSFLVRCWSLTGDRRRLEVIHIKTGERTRVGSLAEALAWLDAHTSPPPADATPPRLSVEAPPP